MVCMVRHGKLAIMLGLFSHFSLTRRDGAHFFEDLSFNIFGLRQCIVYRSGVRDCHILSRSTNIVTFPAQHCPAQAAILCSDTCHSRQHQAVQVDSVSCSDQQLTTRYSRDPIGWFCASLCSHWLIHPGRSCAIFSVIFKPTSVLVFKPSKSGLPKESFPFCTLLLQPNNMIT